MRARTHLFALLASTLALSLGCTPVPSQLPTAPAPAEVRMTGGRIVVSPAQSALHGQATGFLNFHLTWPAAPARTAQAVRSTTRSFRLTVTGGQLSQPITADVARPPGEATASVQVTIPAGSGYTLKVDGLSQSNKIVTSGTKGSLEVTAGAYTPVTLVLTDTVGTVRGTLVDPDTNEPVGGVKVTAGSLTTTTATDGTYLLEDLDPGEQVLTFSLPQTYGGSQTISVVAGAVSQAGITRLSRQLKAWAQQASGISTTIRGLIASSSQEVIAYGDAGRYYVSKDGGTTWELHTITSTPYAINSMRFLEGGVGYALIGTSDNLNPVNAGSLFSTENGGDDWTQVTTAIHGQALELLADGSVVAVRDGGGDSGAGSYEATMFVRTQSGDSSTATNLPFRSAIAGFAALSRQTMLVVSGSNALGAVYKTTSGGSDWSEWEVSGVRPDQFARHCLVAFGPNEYYMAGRRHADGDPWGPDSCPVVMRTTDGGANWSVEYELTSAKGIGFKGLYRVGVDGLVAFGERTIAVRPSGSAQWRVETIEAANLGELTLNTVAFANPLTAWAMGKDGKLLKY